MLLGLDRAGRRHLHADWFPPPWMRQIFADNRDVWRSRGILQLIFFKNFHFHRANFKFTNPVGFKSTDNKLAIPPICHSQYTFCLIIWTLFLETLHFGFLHVSCTFTVCNLRSSTTIIVEGDNHEQSQPMLFASQLWCISSTNKYNCKKENGLLNLN